MEIITLSQKNFNQLSLYDVPKSVRNTESIIYNLNIENTKYFKEKLLLKKFFLVDNSVMANRLFNMSILNSVAEDVNIEELVVPRHIVALRTKHKKEEIIGFTIPVVEDSINMSILLNDFKIDFSDKIKLLYLSGHVLKKIKQFKKKGLDFSFGDFHEDNILVKDNKIHVIDLDSSYLGAGYPMPSKYLATNKNLDLINKYKKSKNGLIIPSKNTDKLCYNMMILGAISHYNISSLDMNSYFQYIRYLNYLGYGEDLIKSFTRVYSSGSNINPCDYLDQIPLDKIGESQYKVYKLKQEKGII